MQVNRRAGDSLGVCTLVALNSLFLSSFSLLHILTGFMLDLHSSSLGAVGLELWCFVAYGYFSEYENPGLV